MTLATAAAAGEHYVEVWNPPEARSKAYSANHHVHKPIERRHMKKSALHTLPHATKRRVSATAASSPSPPNEPTVRRPTFDDIPRRITPEGNVLRVSHKAV
jgi:hypothetical protein